MLGNNKPVVLIWSNRHMPVHKHVGHSFKSRYNFIKATATQP